MEKEPVKIKLSTALLIIAIIVIVAIIGMIYKESITNNNNVSNTENVMLEENSITNTEKIFSETEIKEALQNYLNLSGAYQGEPYGVLQEMKNITGKNVINNEYPEAIEYEGGSILPTNIKYSEFKEFMLNYMTEEEFNTDFASGYVDKNGDLYCKNNGATGIKYEVKNIEKINNSDTKYKGKTITIFEEDAKEEWDIIFEIAHKNNKCVISNITYPGEIQDEVEEKDNTQTTSNVGKDNIKNNILGKWKANKVVDSNGTDLGLSDVWGTGITYSNEMEFKENGTLSYAIGITASSDDGKYTINGNTIKYGIPTDIKGEMDWSTFTYIPEEDILKEEKNDFGEKKIITYIRVN